MPNAIINVGSTGGQINISTAAAPATPAVGVVTLYAGTDKALHALNSDGTDITIAAAGAASPITVVQTNSLVSTAVGGTATAANSVVIGATACSTALNTVVIGNSSRATAACSVVMGSGSCALQPNSIAIGKNVALISSNGSVAGKHVFIGTDITYINGYSDFGGSVFIGNTITAGGGSAAVIIGENSTGYNGSITIGKGSCSSDAGIAIGCSAKSYNFNTGIQIGYNTSNCGTPISQGVSNAVAIGKDVANTGSSQVSIGECLVNKVAYGHTIGQCNTIHTGATGTIVLGNSSVGGTGACNSVVIGNSARTTGACSVTIGYNVSNPASCSIHIPIGSSTVCNTNNTPGGVSIGNGGGSILDLRAGGAEFSGAMIGAWQGTFCGSGGSILLGGVQNRVLNSLQGSVLGGYGNCIDNGYRGHIIGSESSCITAGDKVVVVGGYNNCITGNSNGPSIFGGSSNKITGTGSYSTVVNGVSNTISSSGGCNAILGGCSNTIGSTFTNAVIIGGSTFTAEKSNTTHVDNLIAFGQAASKTNAVGSTGGSVTLNWDNSNIQTLTLTSSITTLTKSNPIDGAVYTLFVTQGGTGSYTVAWGSDVEWPGGTPPTLSTAAGATDAVSLVYIAGVTGYYGNANLNFS
jgi:hypothetical protein